MEGWATDGMLKAGKLTVMAGTGSLTASIVAGTGSLIGTEHEVAGTWSPTVPSSPALHS